jgi:hypothetical protein
MSNSSNLVLPYLAVGQAQKHVTVNETIRKLDAIVQLSVVSATTTAQPGSPDDGAVWILPSGKSGDHWASFADGSLGYYRDGAWVEITPREGWLAYVRDTEELLVWSGAAWAMFAPGRLLTLSASDRLLGRSSSGAGAAEEITCTAAGRALLDDADAREQCSTLGAWHILGASAVAAAHTGDTSETVLASFTLPGGAMGPNGVIRVTGLWTYTNSANNKTLRVRLGGLSGTAFQANVVSTTNVAATQRTIQNRNAQSSQVGFNVSAAASFTAAGSGSPPATGAVDTSVDQLVVLTGQLASASETVTLEACLVELVHRS